MIETKNSVHVKYRLRDARRYKVNYSVMEDIKTLTNISKQSSISTENAQETAHIINRYFGEHKRDQAFRQIEGVISVRFKELLEQFRKIENEKSNPSIKKFFQKAKSFWKN